VQFAEHAGFCARDNMASHLHGMTDDMTFRMKALMAGVAVALIGATGLWLYAPKAQTAAADRSAAAHTAASPTAPIPKPVESRSSAAPTDVIKSVGVAAAKVDKRAAIASEFHGSRNLKAFYDKYAGPAYANDGTAAYYRAMALKDCMSWHKLDPDKFASMFMPNYRNNPAPEVQLRVKAIFNYAERCSGFAEAADTQLIHAAMNRALALNEPGAIAKQLSTIYHAGQHAEAESLGRQLLQDPNPDIVDGILVYLGGRAEGWTPSNFGDLSIDLRRDAWRLAACSWGADCGPTHHDLRAACLAQAVCNSPSYVEYLQQHQYSPENFQRLQQLANFITNSVASRNWEALGLTTTHRSNK
jgi:hypothetical protein